MTDERLNEIRADVTARSVTVNPNAYSNTSCVDVLVLLDRLDAVTRQRDFLLEALKVAVAERDTALAGQVTIGEMPNEGVGK